MKYYRVLTYQGPETLVREDLIIIARRFNKRWFRPTKCAETQYKDCGAKVLGDLPGLYETSSKMLPISESKVAMILFSIGETV